MLRVPDPDMTEDDADGADASSRASETPAIVLEDVTRRYGSVTALDGVGFTVERGHVFALIGPNGAGKTTLVRALTGTTDAEGRVELFGAPPRAVDPGRVGLLPQEFTPTERLTARELVAYYAGLYDDARPVEDVLADVGLASSADVRYENLSGGQRRRACVATALVNDPDLLVLDEPTTGIDPAGRRALRELLAGLADDGTTVFLTTHDMDEAEELADRVALLADGELLEKDAPAVVVSEFGGGRRITLTTDDPDAAATVMADQGRFAQPTDDEIVVPGVAPEDVGDIVDALVEAGVTYESLTWAEPDLEDAYLNLTGTRVGPRGEPIDRRGTDDEEGMSA